MKPTLNHEELIYVWKELFDISGSVRDVGIEMFGWRNSVRAILSRPFEKATVAVLPR
jgi:hypothetical protein